MNKEKIKNELIKRFKERNPNPEKTSLDKASDDITEILNEILDEENIGLTEELQEKLLIYLKPTNTELISNAVKNDIFKSMNLGKS